jgi:hypothetical protein
MEWPRRSAGVGRRDMAKKSEFGSKCRGKLMEDLRAGRGWTL